MTSAKCEQNSNLNNININNNIIKISPSPATSSNNQSYITIIQDPYPPLNNSPELFEQLNCLNQQTTPNLIINGDLLTSNIAAASNYNDFNNNTNGFINGFLPSTNFKKEQIIQNFTALSSLKIDNNDDAIDMKDFY